MVNIQLLRRENQLPLAGVRLTIVLPDGWYGPASTDASGLATFNFSPPLEATVYVEGRALYRGSIGEGCVFFIDQPSQEQTIACLVGEKG